MSAEAARAAVGFYGVQILPRLRAMDPDVRRKMLVEAKSLSGEVTLQHSRGPHRLPGWDAPLSGLQVVTIMVFGLFVELGERQDLCEPLMETWPIADTLLLVDRSSGTG
ncbi:MAG TPA: hypothetical protein VF092_21520 [Longimicrobium sp.]